MTDTWRNWLMARPVAHRGLHGKSTHIVENSIAAASAAISRNFAIECDVQLSSDGEAIVFHDFELERLTHRTGKLAGMKAADITSIGYRDGAGTIPALVSFLDAIGARVPVVIEIKSDFSGNMKLAARTASIVSGRNQPIALKSFDPLIMAYLRKNSIPLGLQSMPLGMVAEASYDGKYWSALSPKQRQHLTHFLHWQDTRPDFLSWNVNDLPHVTPYLLRNAVGVPVMTWTVRTAEQKDQALQWADQIVFEETRGLKVD